MSTKFNLALRLNGSNEKQGKAIEILQNLDKSKFRFQIEFIVEALIYYDEYLKREEKEKQQAERQIQLFKEFLQEMKETILQEMKETILQQWKREVYENEERNEVVIKEEMELEETTAVNTSMIEFLKNL